MNGIEEEMKAPGQTSRQKPKASCHFFPSILQILISFYAFPKRGGYTTVFLPMSLEYIPLSAEHFFHIFDHRGSALFTQLVELGSL